MKADRGVHPTITCMKQRDRQNFKDKRNSETHKKKHLAL